MKFQQSAIKLTFATLVSKIASFTWTRGTVFLTKWLPSHSAYLLDLDKTRIELEIIQTEFSTILNKTYHGHLGLLDRQFHLDKRNSISNQLAFFAFRLPVGPGQNKDGVGNYSK